MIADRPEKIKTIIDLIAEEGKSLRNAAKEVGIAPSTFILWAQEDPLVSEQYARAREERGFFLAEETIEIADNPDLDPNDKRVRIDARKWFSSKLNSKLSDKIDVNHGGQKDNPLTVIERRIVNHARPADDEGEQS